MAGPFQQQNLDYLIYFWRILNFTLPTYLQQIKINVRFNVLGTPCICQFYWIHIMDYDVPSKVIVNLCTTVCMRVHILCSRNLMNYVNQYNGELSYGEGHRDNECRLINLWPKEHGTTVIVRASVIMKVYLL